MPLLKPVRKSRVKSAFWAKAKTACWAVAKRTPKSTQPITMLKHLRKLKQNKQNKATAAKVSGYLRDPLALAKIAQTGRDTVRAAIAARSIKREFIPRVNDCNGVITADDYKQLEKEAGISAYDWDRFGSKNRGL